MNPNPMTDTQKVFQPMGELQARFDAAFAELRRATQTGNLADQDAAHAKIKAIEIEQSRAVQKVRERIRWQSMRAYTTGTPNLAAVRAVMQSIENHVINKRAAG
jgi:hypothetical protein